MLQDLAGRLFARSLRLAHLLGGQPLDRSWQRHGHFAQNGSGLTVAEKLKDGACVG